MKRERSQLDEYLCSLGKTKLLTHEEELALARRRIAGDAEAVDMLVRANLRLVVMYARKYMRRGADFEDLIAAGNIGLFQAALRFEPERNLRLATYATYWIKMSIRLHLKQDRMIHIPFHLQEVMAYWLRAAATLAKQGKTTSFKNIREQIDARHIQKKLTPRLLKCLKDALRVYRCVDLEPTSKSDRQFQVDYWSAHRAHESNQLADETADDCKHVMALINELPEREAKVLRERFGLNDGPERSLKEIGDELGISRERVRQIEGEALARLREKMEALV